MTGSGLRVSNIGDISEVNYTLGGIHLDKQRFQSRDSINPSPTLGTLGDDTVGYFHLGILCSTTGCHDTCGRGVAKWAPNGSRPYRPAYLCREGWLSLFAVDFRYHCCLLWPDRRHRKAKERFNTKGVSLHKSCPAQDTHEMDRLSPRSYRVVRFYCGPPGASDRPSVYVRRVCNSEPRLDDLGSITYWCPSLRRSAFPRFPLQRPRSECYRTHWCRSVDGQSLGGNSYPV